MNPYSSESQTTRTVTQGKFGESSISWAVTLIFALFCIPMKYVGV